MGSNTITLNALSEGTYSDCTIKGTDTFGNVSKTLTISTFEIDTTSPSISEVTAVTDPTNDTTPNYIFSSSEAGTISYGGSRASKNTTPNSRSKKNIFKRAGSETPEDNYSLFDRIVPVKNKPG